MLKNDVDCVIFTGGIGENSPPLHSLVCDDLFPLSHDTFSRKSPVSDITADTESKTRVLVVKTNEELAIAKECVKLLK